jgi:hypothetical protein
MVERMVALSVELMVDLMVGKKVEWTVEMWDHLSVDW